MVSWIQLIVNVFSLFVSVYALFKISKKSLEIQNLSINRNRNQVGEKLKNCLILLKNQMIDYHDEGDVTLLPHDVNSVFATCQRVVSTSIENTKNPNIIKNIHEIGLFLDSVGKQISDHYFGIHNDDRISIYKKSIELQNIINSLDCNMNK